MGALARCLLTSADCMQLHASAGPLPRATCRDFNSLAMLQICTDGTNCKRRVCFFAHLESEVRKRDDSNVPHAAQADMAAGPSVGLYSLPCGLLLPKPNMPSAACSGWQSISLLNACLHLCPAEAQMQQQEVAQAFQVLMNANAQNPGSLANLNLMNSLVRALALAALALSGPQAWHCMQHACSVHTGRAHCRLNQIRHRTLRWCLQGMMGQGGHMPMNPLAERAQQLQQQLQQLQALQALQMPLQPMSSAQMPDMQGGFDNVSLQGQMLGNGGQSVAQQLQQAQVQTRCR